MGILIPIHEYYNCYQLMNILSIFCLLSRQYFCASFSKYIKYEKQCRVIYDNHIFLLIFSSVTEKCKLTEGQNKTISLLHYRIFIPYVCLRVKNHFTDSQNNVTVFLVKLLWIKIDGYILTKTVEQ